MLLKLFVNENEQKLFDTEGGGVYFRIQEGIEDESLSMEKMIDGGGLTVYDNNEEEEYGGLGNLSKFEDIEFGKSTLNQAILDDEKDQIKVHIFDTEETCNNRSLVFSDNKNFIVYKEQFENHEYYENEENTLQIKPNEGEESNIAENENVPTSTHNLENPTVNHDNQQPPENNTGLGVDSNRTLTSWGMYYTHWALMMLCNFLLSGVIAAYQNNWDITCDYNLKLWTLVWLCRCNIQSVLNIIVTRLRIMRRHIPSIMITSLRLLNVFGFAWWLFGIDVVFFETRCHATTLAYILSKVMFWTTTISYIIPLIIYLLLCLCLPCIIYFFVRFTVPPADRRPTPNSVINQLEVKTYREMVESLNRQYNVTGSGVLLGAGIPSLSLGEVIGNVSTLLSSPTTQMAQTTGFVNGGSSTSETALIQPLPDTYSSMSPLSDEKQGEVHNMFKVEVPFSDLSNKESIIINKSCPICMMDLDLEDEVIVMPCDNRHFFHKLCVIHWLETSQVCPICRDNIVHRISGSTETTSMNEQ